MNPDRATLNFLNSFPEKSRIRGEALQDDGIYGLTFDLMGGFLNSVECEITGDIGLGGAPNYWSTWSADNVGGWVLNSGISEELHNGDWFACSYTSWGAATPPSLPMNGPYAFGFEEVIQDELTVYPNPSNGEFSIKTKTNLSMVNIYSQTGALVKVFEVTDDSSEVEVKISGLQSGIYFLELQNNSEKSWKKVIVN
mgnify:CR=1 FL=1